MLKIITCYSHLRNDPGVDEVLLVEAGGEGLDLQQVLLVGGQVREQHLQKSRTIRMEDPPTAFSALSAFILRILHPRYCILNKLCSLTYIVKVYEK